MAGDSGGSVRSRAAWIIAVLAGVLATSPASAGDISVVRVSSPSPFPIGDCVPNDRVFFDDGPGSETDPSVAINPTNPDNIVAAWPSDTAYGIVAASSFDGGQTWTRTPVPGLTKCTGGDVQHMLHARLSFGPDGRLYLSGEQLEGFFPDPRSFIVAVPVVTSMDGGLTWSSPSRVDDLPLASGFDRIMAEPDVPGAAVVVWHGPEGAATSYLSRTTDGGETWVKRELPIPAPEFQPFQSVLAHPDGSLYVFYSDRTLLSTIGILASFVTPTSFESNLWVTRSTDKGNTWSAPTMVTSGVSANWVGTAAGPNGSLYVSTWRAGSVGNDLIVMRSSDQGATWAQPSVVAENVVGPFPMIASDHGGRLGIAYNTPAPGGTKVVFARSADGGLTWSKVDVAGPFASIGPGLYQETASSQNSFASVFIRSGPDTDGPTDVYVARIT